MLWGWYRGTNNSEKSAIYIFRVEYGSSRYILNVGTYPQNYIASYSSIPEDNNLDAHHDKNLKFHIIVTLTSKLINPVQ
jgi:hypothetical protein